MSGKVSLTSSIRNSLLSLQKTTVLQSATQQRLSTGLKVNSAVENPNVYYTARSLSNRARDLSALLDSISSTIQTIDAGMTGLDTISNLLRQGASVVETVITNVSASAEQAYDFRTDIPEIKESDADITKDWLLQNGATSVVTNAEELIHAMDFGPEDALIVVMGNIELDLEVDNNGNPLNNLILRPGQKLVGVEYFGDLSSKAYERGFDNGRSSSITITNATGRALSAITMDENSLISDLDIRYETNAVSSRTAAVMNDMRGSSTISNSDIRIVSTADAAGEQAYAAGVMSLYSNSKINLEGMVNIYNEGESTIGLAAWTGTTNETKAAIEASGNVNIVSAGAGAIAISSHNSTINFKRDMVLGVKSDDALIDGRGIAIGTGSKVYLENTSDKLFSALTDAPPNIAIAQGASFSVRTSKVNASYETLVSSLITMSTTDIGVFTDNFNKTGSSENYFSSHSVLTASRKAVEELSTYNRQYNEILTQVDSVAKDSIYKGINLIKEDNLTVRFNETGSALFEVKGVDATTEGLGIKTAAWLNMRTLEKSLDELSEAVNRVRRYSEDLGNSYSVVLNRESFLQKLINVLEEGSDKLLLADMNEEAAAQLALATRQELAVNSLSLASQAAQSILKLF